jgi:hypothetical protein
MNNGTNGRKGHSQLSGIMSEKNSSPKAIEPIEEMEVEP